MYYIKNKVKGTIFIYRVDIIGNMKKRENEEKGNNLFL